MTSCRYHSTIYEQMPVCHQEIYKWALESVALLALNSRLGCLQHNLPKVTSYPLFLVIFVSMKATCLFTRLEESSLVNKQVAKKVKVKIPHKGDIESLDRCR